MSADEKKRLEYEAREKAIRDYNSQIQSAEEKGEKRGEQRGERRKAASIITNMLQKGKTPEEIADVTRECLEDILKIQSKEYE